ncbi:MAG: hypothetical protein J3K34DRAFT_429828 [Monoraphidium minutum]|nr:MAG: hypothetical protein J3K34DRAFT_429828 [Monoraphidium minutum]
MRASAAATRPPTASTAASSDATSAGSPAGAAPPAEGGAAGSPLSRSLPNTWKGSRCCTASCSVVKGWTGLSRVMVRRSTISSWFCACCPRFSASVSGRMPACGAPPSAMAPRARSGAQRLRCCRGACRRRRWRARLRSRSASGARSCYCRPCGPSWGLPHSGHDSGYASAHRPAG